MKTASPWQISKERIAKIAQHKATFNYADQDYLMKARAFTFFILNLK